jgi:hypothetical protein
VRTKGSTWELAKRLHGNNPMIKVDIDGWSQVFLARVSRLMSAHNHNKRGKRLMDWWLR